MVESIVRVVEVIVIVGVLYVMGLTMYELWTDKGLPDWKD